MEETGKNMVLQKLVQMNQKDLVYLRNQMKKPGYLDEVKSLISEFMQYEIKEEELDEMIHGIAARKNQLGSMSIDVLIIVSGYRPSSTMPATAKEPERSKMPMTCTARKP